MIFPALCCDPGLFSKRLVSPAANLITDFLHIPGGIATSFSLMFLVVAAVMIERFGCAAIMSVVQSALALAFGMVGSMGALSVIGCIVPGFVIDLLLFVTRKSPLSCRERVVLANAIAALCAALTANLIVFRLRGMVLLLILVTTAAAAFHLTTRTTVPEGVLRVELAGGQAKELSLTKLKLIPVQGTVVNGKGRRAPSTHRVFYSPMFCGRRALRNTPWSR